jgi:hypothetical protein
VVQDRGLAVLGIGVLAQLGVLIVGRVDGLDGELWTSSLDLMSSSSSLYMGRCRTLLLVARHVGGLDLVVLGNG